ncbi:MAG: glycosyltransferase [Lascolabacillus sp.]|nr:glycosyltransferase [Lascolabacillus sp.]
MKKFNVMYIFPGPISDAGSEIFQKRFICLSKYLRGYIFTTSTRPEHIKIGDFEYLSCQRNKFFLNLRFLVFCVQKTLSLRMNKGKIDCIITYDPLKTGLIGSIIKLLLNAKLIVEVNGVYTSQVVWIDGKKCFVNSMKKLLTPLIMRFVFSRTDGIYLLFPTQIDQFKKNLQKKPIVSFPCWVPTKFFHNKMEKKEVLFAGFPFKIKGVDVLIKAFKKIAPQYPDWTLKILGWFPDTTELYAAIDSHPQIYHHPPVNYSEMPKHIGECGIFVLPSRTEAMGRVLVEAAAAGKPRIGSNVDGIPTVIENGVDGYLVEPENVDELASKMSLLMGDKSLRERIGFAAALRAKNEFSEDCYIRNTMQFYKNVVATD